MKLHISMQVTDLEQAVKFYSALFNQEPTIARENYVKWDVADPNVNFVIETRGTEPRIDHLGIQVENAEHLTSISSRLEETGHAFLGIERGTCCYADIEKSWVKGPTGEKWEAFLTHSHSAGKYGEDREHLLDDM